MLLALGALDLLAGLILGLQIQSVSFIFGVAELIKGGVSVLGAIAQQFWFDWMGWLDIISGFCLLMIAFGTNISFAPIIGAFLAFKGIFSLLTSVMR